MYVCVCVVCVFCVCVWCACGVLVVCGACVLCMFVKSVECVFECVSVGCVFLGCVCSLRSSRRPGLEV